MVNIQHVVSFSIFEKFNNIVTGISTRKSGSMTSGEKLHSENLSKFFSKFNISLKNIVFMHQVHGNKVIRITDEKLPYISKCDGIITGKKNIFLCATTADCLPIVFYDPCFQTIGICHAGYKGILSGIIKNMLDNLIKSGSCVDDLVIGIGPSIGECCYDVRTDRIDEFIRTFGEIKNMFRNRKNEYLLDLKTVAVWFMTKYGVDRGNIQVFPVCTRCNIDQFYSYRGDTKKTFGEFVTFIGKK